MDIDNYTNITNNHYLTVSDPNDQELCDALANMVAAVLAYPPQHIHLWYHMFAADELLNTFMTGFLVSKNAIHIHYYIIANTLVSIFNSMMVKYKKEGYMIVELSWLWMDHMGGLTTFQEPTVAVSISTRSI